MKNQDIELPLFPLRTVLFPGMQLPLHIFEERYKFMINECLDHGKTFGVVLLEKGMSENIANETVRVGTSAIITQVTRLEKGDMNIISVGYERFRIQELLPAEPYPRAMVEKMPAVNKDLPEAYQEAEKLRARLIGYINALADATDSSLEISNVPEKPELVAFLSAILLQVPLADKQRLLAMETIPQMLALENRLLDREIRFIAANIGMEFSLSESSSQFSAN